MKQRQKRVQYEKGNSLWIQCCNEDCKKWRFVKEYHDPLSVPETWVCSQNLDKKFSSCDIPEEKFIDENTVESKYISGSIVWAKLKGFPWWPAIVDHSPETQCFYELKGSKVPVIYHVTFLEEGEVQRAWVKSENIKPFKDEERDQPTKKAKKVYSHIDYTKSLKKSLEIARSAMALEIDERLRKYSFSVRFKQWEAENLQVAIPQNIETKTQINKRSKRKIRRVKYITSKTDSDRNSKNIKNLVFNEREQGKVLLDSPENKQIALRTSVFEYNQISVINPQGWNICSIQ